MRETTLADKNEQNKVVEKKVDSSLKRRIDLVLTQEAKERPAAFMRWRDSSCGCVYIDRG